MTSYKVWSRCSVYFFFVFCFFAVMNYYIFGDHFDDYWKGGNNFLLVFCIRGAEPKQLAFSAALGISLGVFPICGMLQFQHLGVLFLFLYVKQQAVGYYNQRVTVMDATSIMRGSPQLNNLRNSPIREQVLTESSYTKELIIDSSFLTVSSVGSTWNCLSCIKHLPKTKSYIKEQEKKKKS